MKAHNKIFYTTVYKQFIPHSPHTVPHYVEKSPLKPTPNRLFHISPKKLNPANVDFIEPFHLIDNSTPTTTITTI